MKCQNAVDFCDDQAMVHIKLQIAIMTHVVGFIRQIGYEFLGRFPSLIMNRLANGHFLHRLSCVRGPLGSHYAMDVDGLDR